MKISDTHTKVLIVGAGPTGLMMAAQLLRYGVQPLIIDSKDGPTTHSKALAVQARSLEIYRQMGVIDKVLANAMPEKGIAFNHNGKQQAVLELGTTGAGLTAFPYLLMYEQSKNERLLLDFLTQKTCPVYWDTTLISLRQNANGATVLLKNADGEYILACDWIIGADGARSTVRKQLQIPFNGDTYPHSFYLVDAKLDAGFLNGNYVQLFMGGNGFAGFFPMPEAGSYRVIGNLPETFGEREDIAVEEILPYLNETTQSTVKVVQNDWFTTYKLHHRMADSFRQQRCFLAGDAAHIHSPVGGQGMNTGLQDAYNLAWKLAGVVNGQMKRGILDSYAAERMPVAKTLLKTTDAAFNVIMSPNWFAGFFKKHLLFRALKMIWKSEKMRTAFFKRVSQIDISYRDSKINLHLSKDVKVKAGDRLPYIKIYDEKKQIETDLHQWCSKPGFTLIILGRFDELFLFTIAKWITTRYQGILNFYYLPPSGKNLAVFDAFEANPHAQKAIIIRPDMYIGYISDTADLGMMDNYLRNVVLIDVSL